MNAISFTTLWIYTILKLMLCRFSKKRRFHYLMDLHYSQTFKERLIVLARFTTLWIYTILKLRQDCWQRRQSFTTLWIYTILKQGWRDLRIQSSFTTLWIYTILKLGCDKVQRVLCFTTLWIYTILKPRIYIYWQRQCFTTLWIYTILKPQISCAHYTAQGKSTRYSTIVLWRNGIVKGAQIPIQHIEFGAHIYARRCLAL